MFRVLHPFLRRIRGQSRGQSLIELALIVPLLLFMALAVFDFARVFVASITVEAAAREAADYGSLYPWFWDEDRPENIEATEERMEDRACRAASTLTGYAGSGAAPGDLETCTNPTFSYELIKPSGGSNCYEIPRSSTPCRVEVTLVYDFDTIVPLAVQFFDTRLGIPAQVTLERTSTFAVADFELDRDLEP